MPGQRGAAILTLAATAALSVALLVPWSSTGAEGTAVADTTTTTTAPDTTTTTTAPATTTTAPTTTTTAPPTGPPTGPALAADFPDPTILVSGGTYYAYATEVGFVQIQVTSSVDLVHWTPIADALPNLPGWAEPFHTWAPSVIQIGRQFLMYYTVRDSASGDQCISLATASNPGGPFADTSSGPLVCQLDHGGSIDPAVFVDGSHGLYLDWKSDDNSVGRPTSLWAQQLSADGQSLVGTPVDLLNEDQAWEAPAIEGPGMVQSGGRYYLFYTGGPWETAGAAIGYATCTGSLGPCTKVTVAGPWFASEGGAAGPGSPELFVGTDGRLRMAFDAWDPATVGYTAGGARSLWIARLSFGAGGPVATSDQPASLSASHLELTAPQGADPGAPFSITVRALDASDDVAPGYRGTVHLSSTDPAAELPADYTFTAGDGGTHQFSGVALETAGAQVITATDAATAAISGAATVTVAGTPVAAGGTVWSPSAGATPAGGDPVVVGVTSPTAGTVLVMSGTSVELASPGYWPLPWFADVSAPQGSAAAPLTVTFDLSQALFTVPGQPGPVSVYSDATLVQLCSAGGPMAVPDPCLADESSSNGVIQVDVRSSVGATFTFGTSRVSRLAGPDRTATAVAISQAGFPVNGSAGAVVLARSDDFPDALAGSPLAAVRNAPLLITDPQALDPRVSAEISRVLAPDKTVYILGGGAAISPGVEAAVAALGYQVVRYAGSDRYGTAATIAASGLGSPSTVLEANGEDFPDAVAAGAAAAALHGAVLLTAGSALPAATSAYLSATNPSVRIAVGGPAAAADPGATPVVGADRYATAALLAQQYFPGPTLAGVASGANWPDALAGGSRLGARAGPLLLSDPAGLSDEAATYISTHSPGLADVEIYGGSAALTPNLEPSILSDVSG